MKLITAYLLFLVCLNGYGQEYYYINAENGLNVRSEPTLTSAKTAKLPFGVVVTKIEDTTNELIIADNDKQIKGNWVKIKYNNFLYLVSEETDSFEREGYVFDGYLKPLKNKNSISISEISKKQFNEFLKVVPKQVYKPKIKIGELDSIKTILKGRVEWFTEDAIKSITTDNGQKLIINQRSNDYGFYEESSGYYPEYEILVLEGGHSIDVCFSIKTGETTETAGNPEYIITSPKNTYRLNGFFGGHECISYFFQIKEGEHYTFLTEFSWEYDICTFKDFNWISETKFIYSNMNYQTDSVKGEQEFFLGEIVKSK